MPTRAYYKNRGAFEVFRELSVELRCQIRQHTLPRPPIREFEVCREAREFPLKIYKPCFNSDFLKGAISPLSPYANFETGVLYITLPAQWGHPGFMPMFNKLWEQSLRDGVKQKIEHVAYSAYRWAEWGESFKLPQAHIQDARSVLVGMRGLRSVSLVVDHVNFGTSYTPGNGDNMELVDIHHLRIATSPPKYFFPPGTTMVKAHGGFTWDPEMEAAWTVEMGRAFLVEMAKSFPGWKPPKVQLAGAICGEELRSSAL